jgi:hypothetical protein
MTIGRRTFLRHSALVGALSALASFLSLSSIVSHAELLPASSSPEPDEVGTDSNSVEFKIDGWNRGDSVASAGPTTCSSDPTTKVTPDNQVWLSINQSWRTAWR